jgi:hypothetical protein
MHKPLRSQKKQVSNLDGTIRIAANMQKSIISGRSSYVEMQMVSRLVAYNIKLIIKSIKSLINNDKDVDLSSVSSVMSSGYELTLTPNGIIKRNELEELISTDSDIAILLTIIEDLLKSNSQTQFNEELDILNALLNKRRSLLEAFKA